MSVAGYIEASSIFKPDHLARLQGNLQEYVKEQPEFGVLAAKLTGIAGGFLIPRKDEDIQDILSRGLVFDFFKKRPRLMKGRPCQCHSNSADLWDENKENSRIATGYALSCYGLWRQHSWVIRTKYNRKKTNYMDPGHWEVVETTTTRRCYFGFVMTPVECDTFSDNNLHR